ncbi:exodeoxyribonuclease III [Iodidimonas sp. SYSU 1G8]
MMKIATWNVNSVKARLPRVLEWLKEASPDVALLQEIKVVDDGFPAMEIQDLGYNIATHGQKTYNGVAILSKHRLEDISMGLPGGDGSDVQARYIEAFTGGVRVGCIYLPNGNPAPGDKYDYKLAWMDRLVAHARELLTWEEPLVLGGDYNICPQDEDVWNPAGFATDALCLPQSRNRFRQLLNLGLTDAIRAYHTGPLYSYWDYQAGAWEKDHGLRIDHLLLSPQAADRLRDAGVDRGPRGRERPSDHTPVWCEVEI